MARWKYFDVSEEPDTTIFRVDCADDGGSQFLGNIGKISVRLHGVTFQYTKSPQPPL
jgi:hypothetical protein